MAQIVPGYETQQKVVTVPNNDSDMNSEIATQAVDDWLVASLFPNGTDITILFTRTILSS